MRRFEAGETIALRDVWNGVVWSARPCTVVADVADQTMLWFPAGTRWMAPVRDGRWLRIPQAEFELVEVVNDLAHVLSFSWPTTPCAALLFFRPDGAAWHWYLNLEEPLRATPIGFDTLDLKLDIVLEFDGTWRWKDEDELAEAIRRGVVAAEDEPRLRAETERLVHRIVDREPPFDRDWTRWRPDPSWDAPLLPPGWERV